MKPIAKTPMSSLDNAPQCLKRLYTEAAPKIGMPRKNENSVAACREAPNHSPPIIVAPEREVPGQSARHCTKPIFSASIRLICSARSAFTCTGRRSAHRIAMPPTTSATATGPGLKSSRSEEHTSELQSPCNLVCRLLLEKKKHYICSITMNLIRVPPTHQSLRQIASRRH